MCHAQCALNDLMPQTDGLHCFVHLHAAELALDELQLLSSLLRHLLCCNHSGEEGEGFALSPDCWAVLSLLDGCMEGARGRRSVPGACGVSLARQAVELSWHG